MNPRVIHLALVIGASGAVAFLAFLAFVTVFAGCAAGLPPEPPFTETVTADASRPIR